MTEKMYTDEFLQLKRALQAFQSARINETYSDLKKSTEYAKIGVFFFEKLYAPEDFSFRNTSMRTLQRVLKGKVHKGMVNAVAQVIELHEMTERLDDLMVEKMMELGVGQDLDMGQYQEVYRALDNYQERIDQIRLSLEVTEKFYRLSKKWIVAVSLKTVRSAAHLLGMGKIIDFVYEGYEGFRQINNIGYFLKTVEDRETAWHNEIWANKGVRN